ncbi:O-methyltransferase [Acetobacteroides hydrogenigenes]|uniref:Putative O-methyltransferase YrrM n=1 Tax=Acetobacteroides hydrogenigenes TaxID=979970 RepID=A0A4R2ES25_9BACT|nr:O-methyltransferase [Acetobacteroides hydrogenigenes]TCN70242.1 putative O-methyltransferase YrrM [Acetobacteroides hydrogenigenes]
MLAKDLEIERYILSHTTKEDGILTELNRQTHLKVLQPRMVSGHLQGKILEMVSFMVKPETILEIGTFTGYSAICLAKGLAPNGVLHTFEINDELEEFAAQFISQSNLTDRIVQHIGSALDLAPLLGIKFDLIFIDGDKREYPQYYQMAKRLIKPNGFILADNVLWDGKVIETPTPTDDYTRGILEFNKIVQDDPHVQNVIMPLRDGMTIIRML